MRSRERNHAATLACSWVRRQGTAVREAGRHLLAQPETAGIRRRGRAGHCRRGAIAHTSRARFAEDPPGADGRPGHAPNATGRSRDRGRRGGCRPRRRRIIFLAARARLRVQSRCARTRKAAGSDAARPEVMVASARRAVGPRARGDSRTASGDAHRAGGGQRLLADEAENAASFRDAHGDGRTAIREPGAVIAGRAASGRGSRTSARARARRTRCGSGSGNRDAVPRFADAAPPEGGSHRRARRARSWTDPRHNGELSTTASRRTRDSRRTAAGCRGRRRRDGRGTGDPLGPRSAARPVRHARAIAAAAPTTPANARGGGARTGARTPTRQGRARPGAPRGFGRQPSSTERAHLRRGGNATRDLDSAQKRERERENAESDAKRNAGNANAKRERERRHATPRETPRTPRNPPAKPRRTPAEPGEPSETPRPPKGGANRAGRMGARGEAGSPWLEEGRGTSTRARVRRGGEPLGRAGPCGSPSGRRRSCARAGSREGAGRADSKRAIQLIDDVHASEQSQLHAARRSRVPRDDPAQASRSAASCGGKTRAPGPLGPPGFQSRPTPGPSSAQTSAGGRGQPVPSRAPRWRTGGSAAAAAGPPLPEAFGQPRSRRSSPVQPLEPCFSRLASSYGGRRRAIPHDSKNRSPGWSPNPRARCRSTTPVRDLGSSARASSASRTYPDKGHPR